MGYLNNQLEKVASYAMEKRAALIPPLAAGGGAALGALNSEEGNRIASILGGTAGGYIGGMAGLPIGMSLGSSLDEGALARLLNKHPKLLKLLKSKAAYATIAGAMGAGAYGGSELTKKLKNALFD